MKLSMERMQGGRPEPTLVGARAEVRVPGAHRSELEEERQGSRGRDEAATGCADCARGPESDKWPRRCQSSSWPPP